MKIIKLLCFSLLFLMALSVNAQYVDLGLPSETKWKAANEIGGHKGFYTYDEAVKAFGDKLPTKEQLKELYDKCKWTWSSSRDGYIVTGVNGNSIFLPAAGCRSCDGVIDDVGFRGSYCSLTPYVTDESCAWYLYFTYCSRRTTSCYRCVGLSVRLVQD